MEHLKKEIHRLTDLLQVALSYGELGEEAHCKATLSEAVTVMTDLLEHLAKRGIRMLSQVPDKPSSVKKGEREKDES
jgi:hypothetical protein